MDFEDFVKSCDKCEALIPMRDKICEYCGFEFIDRVLTEEELQIPFQDIITAINNAFFRLESFMAGTITNYKSFDFKGYFDLFFAKVQIPVLGGQDSGVR